MGANLVLSALQRLHLHQTGCSPGLVECRCPVAFQDPPITAGTIPIDFCVDVSRRMRWAAMHESVVSFRGVSRKKARHEQRVRLVCLCYAHDAGCASIQSVHNARKFPQGAELLRCVNSKQTVAKSARKQKQPKSEEQQQQAAFVTEWKCSKHLFK